MSTTPTAPNPTLANTRTTRIRAVPAERSPRVDSQAALVLAMALLKEGRLQESEIVFKRVIALAVDASEGYYGLGVVQLRRGDVPGAALLFQNCVRLDANNANAYYYLGECWEKQGLPGAAKRFYKKALIVNPEHRAAREKLQTVSPGQDIPRAPEFRGGGYDITRELRFA